MRIVLKKVFAVLTLSLFILQMANFKNDSVNIFFRGMFVGSVLAFCIIFFLLGYFEKNKPALPQNAR